MNNKYNIYENVMFVCHADKQDKRGVVIGYHEIKPGNIHYLIELDDKSMFGVAEEDIISRL